MNDPLLSSSKSHPRSAKTENFFMEIPRQNDDFFFKSQRNLSNLDSGDETHFLQRDFQEHLIKGSESSSGMTVQQSDPPSRMDSI